MQHPAYIFLVLTVALIGVVIGYIIRDKQKPATDGKLRQFVDPDDGPYLFLELKPDSDPTILMNKKYAIFEVDCSDLISHD